MRSGEVLLIGVVALLAACGGGEGGNNGGSSSSSSSSSSSASSSSSSGSATLTGTPVAVFETLPTQGSTWVLKEVDTVYTSQVDSSSNTNGSTFYLAPEASQISNKSEHIFTPGYFIGDDEICLSTATSFAEIRMHISYESQVSSDVLLRACGRGDVDFTAFPEADLISVQVSEPLLANGGIFLDGEWPFGATIIQPHRDAFNIASQYLAGFDIDGSTNTVRLWPSDFPFGFFADNWTYVTGYLDRTSGHICVADTEDVGGYMMAYVGNETNAVTAIGGRVILDLFSEEDSLNPEAMLYWGARCE